MSNVMYDVISIEDNVEEYIRLPIAKGCRAAGKSFALKVTSCRHFRRFGIRDGALIVFDMDRPFEEGKVSCFVDMSKEKPKFRLSTTFLEGYEYAGSLARCLNYYN
ncbi:MAG: hypothetical protein ACI3W5_05435 [Faecousia sp.]